MNTTQAQALHGTINAHGYTNGATLYTVSVRDMDDWDDVLSFSGQQNLSDWRSDARKFGAKLWIMTTQGHYLGTIAPSGKVIWCQDIEPGDIEYQAGTFGIEAYSLKNAKPVTF